MLKEVLSVFVLLTSIPVGLVLARLTPEELADGRKWFKLIILVSVLGVCLFYFLKNYVIALTFVYILIVTFVSFMKSKS